ncbi:TIGR03915 family putative DNA repair protein, partial [Rubrivirga sp.]|uniref:TIGR03915 family putative DNA repair protein n=1 Tax=Rubrivirga sp. TaxID=1885344 RepID=UPI003C76E759
ERAKPGLVGRMRRAFLSERPGIEVDVIRLADAVRLDGSAVVEDWTFPPSRTVAQWSGRVGREAHRMEAFVRFETREHEGREEFVAEVRPEYNVLPILHHHFETRYPTLAWRIVDVRRGIALVHTPAPDRASDAAPSRLVPTSDLEVGEHTSEEAAYQSMWRAYFRAVDIPERKNLKLHLRHVPKRYWPYLIEKQPEIETTASRTKPTPSAPRQAVPERGPRETEA